MYSTTHQDEDFETDLLIEHPENTEKPSVADEILNDAKYEESRLHKGLNKQ